MKSVSCKVLWVCCSSIFVHRRRKTNCAIPAFATITVNGPKAFTESSIKRWTSSPEVTSAAMPTAEPFPWVLRRSEVRESIPA